MLNPAERSAAVKRNRAKGNKLEAQAVVYLQGKGYLVHRAVQSGFFIKCKPCRECGFKGRKWIAKSNDIFGLFDIFAVAPTEERNLLVQVTMDTGASERRRKILEQARNLNLRTTDHELWIWTDGRPTPRSRVRQTWRAERLVETAHLEGQRLPEQLFGWTRLGELVMDESEGGEDGEEEQDHEAHLPFGDEGEAAPPA